VVLVLKMAKKCSGEFFEKIVRWGEIYVYGQKY
jgi:hypothetical protein